MSGVSELLYLPAPGASDTGGESRPSASARDWPQPAGRERARGGDADAGGRGWTVHRPEPSDARVSRLPSGHQRLPRRAWAAPDDDGVADGAFHAQRLAQETGGTGLFIDRSAEAAHAYAARAGFAALRAATGGNLNIAV